MLKSIIGADVVNLTCAPSGRSFATTSVANRLFAHVVRRRTKHVDVLPSKKPEYPPYPYGDAQIYKQSNRGLYGGKVLQFGNKISEKFNQKSGRIFYPNIQKTVLYSDALKQRVPIRLATSVLRTITKEGGLDQYLIKDTSARIKELGPFGWRLRYDVLKRMEDIERTSSKIVPGLSVGKARLIKDLFTLGNETDRTFRAFRAEHRDATPEELLKSLQSAGVDTSKYKSAE